MIAEITSSTTESMLSASGPFQIEPATGSGTLGAVATKLRGLVRSGSRVSIVRSIGSARRGMSAKYSSTSARRLAISKLPATMRVAVSGP